MKTIHLKSALISSLIVYAIAIIAFVASYFYPVMDDADLQANYVLSFVIIPAAFIGAHIYYRKGHLTNGIVLGLIMFLIAIVLDALITVPFFIIPYGGDYISFFTDRVSG
ncbi:MAG: DUF5367 family protein [Saprospiraceae bacterium]|nr:DUF5367 family protein [Saprospiraceae bacterium]